MSTEQPPPFPAAEYSPYVQNFLKDVQTQMIIYSNALNNSVTNPLNPFNDPAPRSTQSHQPIQLPQDPAQDLTVAAENVARALEQLADAHPSSHAGSEYRRKAKKFRRLAKLPAEKQRGMLGDIAHGLLLIIVAPVALAGMVVYVTGVMLEGTGLILKGAGYQGKRLFRLDKKKEPMRAG